MWRRGLHVSQSLWVSVAAMTTADWPLLMYGTLSRKLSISSNSTIYSSFFGSNHLTWFLCKQYWWWCFWWCETWNILPEKVEFYPVVVFALLTCCLHRPWLFEVWSDVIWIPSFLCSADKLRCILKFHICCLIPIMLEHLRYQSNE